MLKSMVATLTNVVLCLSCLLLANQSDAADIKKGANLDCPVELSGTISIGDFDRIRTISDELGWTENGKPIINSTEGDLNRVICLSGPGGNYLEGRKIADFIYNSGIGTKVNQLKECYSACAFVFLAGRNNGDEVDTVNRVMHPTSIIGFHAPYLSFDNTNSFSASEVNMLIKQWNLLIADMLKFYTKRSIFDYNATISINYFASILATGPKEFFLVSTIEHAFRLNISIIGYNENKIKSKQDSLQLCRNIINWASDRDSQVVDRSDVIIEKEENLNRYKIIFQGYVNEICEINKSDKGYEVCIDNQYNGLKLGSCPGFGLYFSELASMPPKTLIESIK